MLAKDYLLREKPFLCIIWHQFSPLNMILADLCRDLGIPLFFLEDGLLPGSVNIERNGQMAESDICINTDDFNSLLIGLGDINNANNYIATVVKNNTNRKIAGPKLSTILDVEELRTRGKKIIFYAGQNDPKTGMISSFPERRKLHSPIFSSTFDGLKSLAKHCKEIDAILLYKPHPSVADYEVHNDFDFVQNPHVVYVPLVIDFLDCVRAADVFATIVSTGAYQALFRNIPTIILGRMPLSDSGAVYQITCEEEITGILSLAVNNGITIEQKHAFLNHVARLSKYYLFQYDSEYFSYFPKTIASFIATIVEKAEELQVQLDEIKAIDSVIKINYKYKSQLLIPQDTMVEEYVNSYSHQIGSIDVFGQNSLAGILNFPEHMPVIQENNIRLQECIVIFIASTQYHHFMIEKYKSVYPTTIILNAMGNSGDSLALELEATLPELPDTQQYRLIVPVDHSGLIGEAYYLSRKHNIPLAGIVLEMFNPTIMYQDRFDGQSMLFTDAIKKCDWVLSPGVTQLTYEPDINVAHIGFWDESKIDETPVNDVLIYVDFTWYNDIDRKEPAIIKWIEKLSMATRNAEMSYKILFSETESELAQKLGDKESSIEQLSKAIDACKLVISPFSNAYYLARSRGKGAIIYDQGASLLLTFERHVSASSCYLRNISDLQTLLINRKISPVDSINYFPSKLLASFGSSSISATAAILPLLTMKPDTNQTQNLPHTRGHIVMYALMPNLDDMYGYERGYHTYLLSEVLAQNGYLITFVTDKTPYFLDNFESLPDHKNISLVMLKEFQNSMEYIKDNVDFVIVSPGISGDSQMCRNAIECAYIYKKNLIQLDFKAPQLFDVVVSSFEDEDTWENARTMSKFSSLILSPTNEVVSCNKDLYQKATSDSEHKCLNGPINSAGTRKFCTIGEKEKRVMCFLPKHVLQGSKDWGSIVDIFTDDFLRGYTLVFICLHSLLDPKFKQSIENAAERYNFSIVYKRRLTDAEKFSEISRSSLVAVLSTDESYPYIPLEALSLGTPCIAFDTPTYREICEDNLLYAPIGDWAALQALISHTLTRRYRLTEAAMEYSYKVASIESIGHKVQLVLDDLSSKPIILDELYTSKFHFYEDLDNVFDSIA